MYLTEALEEKWSPILDHPGLAQIKDPYRRAVTALVLENQEKAMAEEGRMLNESAPTNSGGGLGSGTNIGSYDPILISLVRRALPNLIAYDVCGVQPMSGPTGLIFAMRSKYKTMAGTEALFNEANSGFSGTNAVGANGNNWGSLSNTNPVFDLSQSDVYGLGRGMTTAQAEALGDVSTNQFQEMAFAIDKVTVTARSRALKAEYTMELAQDLKAVHGLDAETELSNILSTEILAEINREVIRTLFVVAKQGASTGTTTAGVFDLDTDSNGRWLVEKFKGMMFQIEREMNKIAQDTRRGKGNIIICSSNVASALQMAGILDYTPALNGNNGLSVDDTGNTFVGVLHGKIRVYIDPYAGGDFMVAGYKGSSAFDAGIFYCPYVPLQMVRAVDQDSFHPKIGFKTRYGMVAHPFAQGSTATTAGTDGIVKDSNVYYRRLIISNLM